MKQSFYGKIYSQGYDLEERRSDMLPFYLDKWKKAGKPGPVLEPMCGTGYFLIPFLEAGADIDGVDASPYMLAECRKKCVDKGLDSSLHQQLIEEINLSRQYGFIFIPDRSFGHLYEREAAQKSLQKLWDCLLPGGWFVLDVKTPPEEGAFGKSGETEIEIEDRPDGSTVWITSLWSERDGGRVIRNLTKYEVYINGELNTTELFEYNERFYDTVEFKEMLRTAGFMDIQTTKAYGDTEPSEHDIVVFSCRKSK